MASRTGEQTGSVQAIVSFLLPLILKLKIACCFMSIYKSDYFFLTWNIPLSQKEYFTPASLHIGGRKKNYTDNRTVEKCLCHLVLCHSPAETGETQHCHMDVS